MLVLTRRRREKIIIGDDIVITVLGVYCRRGYTQIGISAPHGISIVRSELVDRQNDTKKETEREVKDDAEGTA